MGSFISSIFCRHTSKACPPLLRSAAWSATSSADAFLAILRRPSLAVSAGTVATTPRHSPFSSSQTTWSPGLQLFDGLQLDRPRKAVEFDAT